MDIVYKLSQALSSRGHDVTVCTGDYEIDEDYINALTGVEVVIFQSWLNRHGFYIMPGIARFDVSRYDAVHLHCYRSFQNIVICGKAMHSGVPYLVDAHGSTADIPGPKQLVRKTFDALFGHNILDRASRAVAETQVGAEEYKRLGVAADKIRLLHPMLNTSEFDKLPERGAFRRKYEVGSRFAVLFLGRLHRDKGIQTLVDAVKRLVNTGLDTFLVIAGQDDGFKRELERRVYDNDLTDRVLFTGFLSAQDKLSALVDADVLVQPSRNEAGARPSLEALLCNTPVVVSRGTGAGREIAAFDGGLLFNYGDSADLTSALQHIHDCPEETRQRTEKAKDYIKSTLSLSRQVVQYENLYQEMLA